MKVLFQTGANSRFPQSSHVTETVDGKIRHVLKPRNRRWAVLEIGREKVHVDLGWADDPDSVERQRVIEVEMDDRRRVVSGSMSTVTFKYRNGAGFPVIRHIRRETVRALFYQSSSNGAHAVGVCLCVETTEWPPGTAVEIPLRGWGVQTDAEKLVLAETVGAALAQDLDVVDAGEGDVLWTCDRGGLWTRG